MPVTVLLPERLNGPDGLLLRRWRLRDADILAAAVAESIEHLRPWMAWVQREPMTVEQHRSWLTECEREWAVGGDVNLAVFVKARVAGACGLHRRIAADGLEIGYWTHPAFTRRGLATTASRLLTDAAFLVPGITHVEIHHDKSNRASAAIPRKLGYRLVQELPDQIEAPAEVGIDCVWRMDANRWSELKAT